MMDRVQEGVAHAEVSQEHGAILSEGRLERRDGYKSK